MREFAFVIFDESDEITERYNLDYVTNLSGLGYALNISTVETDVEDYVTKITQNKKNLSMTVTNTTGYSGGNALVSFLQTHNDDVMCLEYNDTERVLYLECKVQSVSKTELNAYGKVLDQTISIKPLTPFFEKIENDVTIQIASVGKSYPYTYPYSYGLNVVTDNEINNTYIKDIPLIVTINGSISDPIITLRDSETNTIYNEVRFVDVDLTESQQIIINSAQKKIWYDDGSGDLVDYYSKLDGAYDSYLRADPLLLSKLTINLLSTDTGSLVGTRRQYQL